jgi:hypothetical protein
MDSPTGKTRIDLFPGENDGGIAGRMGDTRRVASFHVRF